MAGLLWAGGRRLYGIPTGNDFVINQLWECVLSERSLSRLRSEVFGNPPVVTTRQNRSVRHIERLKLLVCLASAGLNTPGTMRQSCPTHLFRAAASFGGSGGLESRIETAE